MTSLRPDGIYYAGSYKVRQGYATPQWLVIHRPTGQTLSAHEERDHAVAEAERLATKDHAEVRR